MNEKLSRSEATPLLKDHRRKVNKQVKSNLFVQEDRLKLALSLQNQCIKLKEMMKTNGPLWLNLIHNFLRKKKSLRSLERKSSRKKSKKNLISSLMKRKERKILKNKKRDNIINYKSSKQKLTINVNEKKKKSMKERYSSKSK